MNGVHLAPVSWLTLKLIASTTLSVPLIIWWCCYFAALQGPARARPGNYSYSPEIRPETTLSAIAVISTAVLFWGWIPMSWPWSQCLIEGAGCRLHWQQGQQRPGSRRKGDFPKGLHLCHLKFLIPKLVIKYSKFNSLSLFCPQQ